MNKIEEYQWPIPEESEVVWTPWVDAYKLDLSTLMSGLEESGMSQTEELDEDEAEERFSEEINIYMPPIKTILTPHGVLPLTEQSLASSHFKFWVGHTNFNITHIHQEVINNCLGVETLEILTPLRFKISVGFLFRDREVMSKIRQNLLEVVNQTYDIEE